MGVPLACLLLVLGADAQPAGARRTLVFGGDTYFPPYEYLDERGQPAGLNVELIREVARLEGFDVEIRLMPWRQLPDEVAAGRIDIATLYRSPARAERLAFAIPHELVYHELFIRKDRPPLSGLGDLQGKKVLVEANSYADEELRGMGLTVTPVESEPGALEALARGEGDVAVVTQVVGRPFRYRFELAARISPSGPPVLLSEYAFITARGRDDVLHLLNDGVAKAKANGDYEELYRRWVDTDRSAQRFRWAAAALVVALLVVLLVVGWSRTLQRRVAEAEAAVRREYEEKEQVRAALEQSEHSLRTAQKLEAIGRLTGGVAHDFNNVLAIILNYATLIRQEHLRHHLPTEDVDEVIATSERAARLTRRLLAFSRATPVEMAPLDLVALVAGMRTLLERLVGSTVTVSVELPAEPWWVLAEPTLLEQVLLNLAANARDAMPGGGAMSVRVEPRPAEQRVALVVRDEGVGMDATVRSQLFDPFFTTKEVGRGTGLGLATVMANVTRLGGTVAVESAPGQGATFTVLLPLTPAPEEGPGSSPVEPAVRGQGQRVLLVEDDEALRRAACLSLLRAGYQVVEAADGKEALEVAATPPELLVTDVILPQLGGAQLAAELRRRQPGLKVLFVSGYVAPHTELGLQAPGTAFLAKPYAGPGLVAAVGRLLEVSPPG